MNKTNYLLRSFVAWVFRKNMNCPNCGSLAGRIVDRKYCITTLRRCMSCRLLYRSPTDPRGLGSHFYQKKYRQGFTTEMPNDKDLQELIKKEFKGSPRDYSPYLGLLKKLAVSRQAKVLEYGCSWGYGAWQIKKYGFKVKAYEISKPRCRYAREKLGIDAFTDLEKIRGQFDVVFSAHVLEHVDSVEVALCQQMQRVKPGGWLLAVTPNGSASFRSAKPEDFHHLWGFVHPQLLDDQFLKERFMGMQLLLSSIGEKTSVDTRTCNPFHLGLSQWELVFAVQKKHEKHD